MTAAPAPFLGGYVAAEGYFGAYGRRFCFAIRVGARDQHVCDGFAAVLGVGRVHRRARRRAHYDDEVSFQVQSVRELVAVLVPFMDAHLPPSHKRHQYLAWRRALLDHWERAARRRRSCTEPGCHDPHRAHGLCRHHLWVRHRR